LIRSLNPRDEEFVKKFTSFLENNWNDPNFQMDKFSQYLGFSQSQFYRKVRKLTGKSPIRFLNDYKLDRAIEFFHNKNGNISEIAIDCGFNSASYFSKIFYKKYHILPSNYQINCV
jgi:AraC-like DNA-binding protein